MKIVCIGGGAAGLYFALLMKLQHPEHSITVVERNRPYDTFGWGVVFSDATMEAMRQWDPKTASAIEVAFNHWDDIELVFKGRKIRTTGHGFVGIGRKHMLNILQDRCKELGVELIFEREVNSDEEFPDADLIIAADGVNSKIRNRYPEVFKPDLQIRNNRFIWLGTNRPFDSFTFDFQKSEHGWFQAHIYKFDEKTSTFIVETTEEIYNAHGLGEMTQEESIAFCEKLFADTLEGHKLMTNATHLRGSAWINFNRLVCENWSHYNGKSHVVLMGDSAHTAHFAIGSGTKLAFDDAIELTRQFNQIGHEADKIPQVLAIYEEIRRVDVVRIQNAARNAMEWFEVVGQRYADTMEPEQFMYSMLTRSQRISHENLRLRDKEWLEGYERWFANQAGVPVADGETPPPPMFTPFNIGKMKLKNRIVMSPMAMYCAQDGMPNEFHFVHFGARALGGTALLFTEMAAPVAEGRITHGCLGIWNDEQAREWRRVVDFVHAHGAKMGIQIGHSGRKGATKLASEGIDQPLDESQTWEIISPSPLPYLPHSQVPREMTHKDMEEIKAAFVDSTRRAADAGFDIVELHCAHGYLLSSFLSPLTNHRTDEYGGSHENRARYPLEVLRAMRKVWPADRPISVRISAHDWAEGGNTPDDAEILSQMFKDAGADIIDCSSGQVVSTEKPVYGRMFQTPFSDQIRNELGVSTIAVGNIYEPDHVNSIIAAGRADLCALARPHLMQPNWTLEAAADLKVKGVSVPAQYERGYFQYSLNRERAKSMAGGK